MFRTNLAQILGVGLTMTTELIGFYTGEERGEEEWEEETPWASREVLAGAGFSEKSDVYSFGIVLWEIMQKEPSLPYASLLPSQVFVCVVCVVCVCACRRVDDVLFVFSQLFLEDDVYSLPELPPGL